MTKFLGDEPEETRRKSELKSIFTATFYGWILGGVVGFLLGGYGGFLIGLFAGMVGAATFASLGVKAERRMEMRKMRKQEQGGPRTDGRTAHSDARQGPPENR